MSKPEFFTKVLSLKNTEEALAFGKDLSRDQAKSLWNENKKILSNLEKRKASFNKLSNTERQQFFDDAFRSQMMSETVQAHLGAVGQHSLTYPEIEKGLSTIKKLKKFIPGATGAAVVASQLGEPKESEASSKYELYRGLLKSIKSKEWSKNLAESKVLAKGSREQLKSIKPELLEEVREISAEKGLEKAGGMYDYEGGILLSKRALKQKRTPTLIHELGHHYQGSESSPFLKNHSKASFEDDANMFEQIAAEKLGWKGIKRADTSKLTQEERAWYNNWFLKLIPVAGVTTAGALLTEQAQAEEPTEPSSALTNLRTKLATTSTNPQDALMTLRSKTVQSEQAADVTGALSTLRQKVQGAPSLAPSEVQPTETPPGEEKVPWYAFWKGSAPKDEALKRLYGETERLYKEAGKEIPRLPEREEMPFLMDLTLLVASGMTGGKGAEIAVAKWGPKVGKLAMRIIEGLATGATYEAARGLMGETPEIPFTDIEAPTGTETLTWGMWPVGTAVAGKTLRIVGGATLKTLKGVDLMLHKPFEKIAEPLRPAADWLWDNIIIQPTNIQIPIIKKSVREMFQPAVERLAQSKVLKQRMTASTFRKTEAMKSLTTDVGRSLSHEMEALLPSEQYEVLKGLRGTSVKDLTSSKAKDVLSRFEGRIHESDLNFLYENRFREELSKGLTKSIENIEEEVSPASISRFLKLFESKLPQKVKITDVHDMMREIIAHPKVNDEMKTFIKDMWSTPARTPMAVADAAREASTFYLTEKLIANRGIVSAIPKEGYVLSKWGRFDGQYVPRDIELQLQDISKIPQIARGVYQKWFLTPWKVAKTITRPAYHMRNLISNAILNDWGGLPFYRADVYMSALKGMRSGSTEWKKFKQMTGAGGTFVQQDIYQLGAGLEYGASTFDKLYNVFEKTVQPMAGLQSAEENLFKFAKYLHNTKELGMKPAEASIDALKWCFNYGEVTTQTAYLRKYGMPFATWYTKSIPLMAETAFKHPLRFGKWLAFGAALQSYAMDQVGVTDSEWEMIEKTLPNYIQKGIYLMMPWRDDKERLNLLNMTYILPGIGDVNELWNQAEQGLQVPNPMITILGTLSSKKKFSGAPLYYEWEPPSTKWMKSMSYVWEQLSPAIVPGGTDWNLMWKAVTEQEGAPSPEQALGSWFGFKMTPVDPGREARRTEAIRKIYESEINMEMKRDLGKTKSSEEQQAVLRKYQQIRESVANP